MLGQQLETALSVEGAEAGITFLGQDVGRRLVRVGIIFDDEQHGHASTSLLLGRVAVLVTWRGLNQSITFKR